MSGKPNSWPVIGHTHVVAYLQHVLKTNALVHAYVFIGPQHVGKTTVADLFISRLLCAAPSENQLPCGTCIHCRHILTHSHPDCIDIVRNTDEETGTVASWISVEQVRSLQNQLHAKPFLAERKVVRIFDADRLSTEAANSLLKALEEPGPGTVFVLMTSRAGDVMPTILSRCQAVYFTPVPHATMLQALGEQYDAKKKAETLAAIAHGCPGIAIRYMQEPEALEAMLAKAHECLALHRLDRPQQLLRGVAGKEITRQQAREQLALWQLLLRDLLLLHHGQSETLTFVALRTELEAIAQHYTPHQLTELLEDTNQLEAYIDANVSPKWILESLILQLPTTFSV